MAEKGFVKLDDAKVREAVSEYYGQDLTGTEDLKTCGCVTPAEEESALIKEMVNNIAPEVKDKYYGCGSPMPPFITGCTILDLGSGTGRDVYTLAQLAGEEGMVIGVDMTDEQLAVANKYVAWHQKKFGFAKPNTVFKKGYIEDLKSAGIEDNSVDVIISNCVINLSPNKEAVMKEAYRVLKPGGEMFFSDIYVNKRLPDWIKADKVLVGECLGNALYINDAIELLRSVGFADPRVVTSRIVPVYLKELEGATFYSNTVRFFKLPLEPTREYYGQTATYLGTVPHHPHALTMDRTLPSFVTSVETPIDGNTAIILQNSRYAKHFIVTEKMDHEGEFGGLVCSVASSWRGGTIFARTACTGGSCSVKKSTSCCGGDKKATSCCGGDKKACCDDKKACCGDKKCC